MRRPVLLDVVGGVGGVGPLVAVGAHFAVAVEVVEQHELLGDGVVVGRDLAAEQAQARVAVALGDIAEDLVVGAVLLDDVDDVLDGRAGAHLARDDGGGAAAARAPLSAGRRCTACWRRPAWSGS